jgi:hypothetical protein
VTGTPGVTILGSQFVNLGFTDVIEAITVTYIVEQQTSSSYRADPGYGKLKFPPFSSKGIVLNLEDFAGSVSIDSSSFS